MEEKKTFGDKLWTFAERHPVIVLGVTLGVCSVVGTIVGKIPTTVRHKYYYVSRK